MEFLLWSRPKMLEELLHAEVDDIAKEVLDRPVLDDAVHDGTGAPENAGTLVALVKDAIDVLHSPGNPAVKISTSVSRKA